MPLAAAVESLSSHPIAAAIAVYAREQGAGIGGASDYQTHAGKGVCAVVDGRRVYVGSAEWLDSLGANASRLEDWARAQREGGATVMFAAAEDRLLGGFALADGVRPTAKEAIADLNELGVRSVMLTGDNPQTANAIGRNLGVTDVRASLLPADKERVIAGLQSEGRKVMMVGDGINDAPALTRADLGVAIGQGTDVAIESADVVLVRDDPTLAAGMIRLGRATIRNIRENLFWAFIYNAIGIPVAAGALMPLGIELDPMFAALAMSLSSVCVVTNALRLAALPPQAQPNRVRLRRVGRLSRFDRKTENPTGREGGNSHEDRSHRRHDVPALCFPRQEGAGGAGSEGRSQPRQQLCDDRRVRRRRSHPQGRDRSGLRSHRNRLIPAQGESRAGKTCPAQSTDKPPENTAFSGGFYWQGQKDSNPQQRFWRPTCYHYTMPLRAVNVDYYIANCVNCQQIFLILLRSSTGGVRRLIRLLCAGVKRVV